MSTVQPNETSQADKRNPHMLAKRAKKEIRTCGKTAIICPKCGTAPEISTTERYERTIVSCQCGYLYDVEINL